ncbi:MAG: PRD domain-containing protein [Erysipelotrichaceae bacterium]|nr:PRD domain-containing protein [Erysipelotrichaceae bacterium]MDD3924084.1 PRD domain-containing protein [Erysipelotrichaceae bacterium]
MDQYDLLILIITRIRPRSLDKLTDSQIDTPFGNALEKIVNLIQRKVYDNYFFSLDKYEFRVRLLLHLNNMFIRINNSINIRNPQLDKIKNDYPFIYDISIFIADLILKETQIQLSEDEIAYIAMHIGVEIEEQKSLLNRINVLIMNPFPLIQHNLFKSRLNSILNDQLQILDFIYDPEDINKYSNVDLLISTSKINHNLSIPWIEISDYLTINDSIIIKKSMMRSLINVFKIISLLN